LIFTNWRFPTQSYGKLVFANSFNNGENFDKIEVISDAGTVTLEHDDKYWHVKEADGYHINVILLNNILLNLNNATYYAQRDYSKQLAEELDLGTNGVRVKTYAKGKKLDDVIVGKRTDSKEFWYIRPAHKNEIWMVDGVFLLPREFYSWIMQPVLEFPKDIVKSITSNNITISRTNSKALFTDEKDFPVPLVPILDTASYIVAENVLKINNFDNNNYPEHRQITFSMYGGLIVSYDIYTDGNEYFMIIDLKTTPLPKQTVNAYIKANKLFYDGWVFKLPNEIGEELFNVPLI